MVHIGSRPRCGCRQATLRRKTKPFKHVRTPYTTATATAAAVCRFHYTAQRRLWDNTVHNRLCCELLVKVRGVGVVFAGSRLDGLRPT